MFETIEMAPADPILGLSETFKKDPNPDKIDLSVGVYKDETGRTPVLETVRRVEEIVLRRQSFKSYLPIDGMPEFGAGVRELVFGAGQEVVTSGRAVTAQTPGGTGGLRVAGDFINRLRPGAKIWLSDPTWENHKNIFKAAGLELASYPYYDRQTKKLAFDKMAEALGQVPPGDVVLFHACCHNPSGMDPTPGQWGQLADLVKRRGFLPLFDFAYQGLGDGLDEDAVCVRTFARDGLEMLVVSSFSKNFGLYNERVGALTVVANTKDAAAKAMSQVKACIRANYSNPPAHGAAVVATILGEPAMRAAWVKEVAAMRERIKAMRQLFVKTLAAQGVREDFGFITTQRGMFSFSGLTKEQVLALRQRYAIYIVDSGRINVAGMTERNMGRLCQAIAEALK